MQNTSEIVITFYFNTCANIFLVYWIISKKSIIRVIKYVHWGNAGGPQLIRKRQSEAAGGAESKNNRFILAEELDAPESAVNRHLKAIGKVKKLDKWFDLTDVSKKYLMETSHLLISRSRNEDFLGRLITSDRKWILYDSDKTPKDLPKSALHPCNMATF